METTKAAPKENRLVVTLPDDLKRKFKIACVSKGVDMTETVRELVEQWVAKNASK